MVLTRAIVVPAVVAASNDSAFTISAGVSMSPVKLTYFLDALDAGRKERK
jgi:hypothetical protein